MKADHLEILVEEPSMEAFLRVLLPRLLGDDTSFDIYPYQCKDDLLIKLPARLKGYASWLPETWHIVVVVDRDDDDCGELKARLEAMAAATGLVTRATAKGPIYSVANRLAIEELEAWYFGDWAAVRAAFPRVPDTIPAQSRFRDPDAISGGTWEAFERVLQKAGYFKGGLRKIEAARSIAAYMEPARSSSKSFQVLHAALLEMAVP